MQTVGAPAQLRPVPRPPRLPWLLRLWLLLPGRVEVETATNFRNCPCLRACSVSMLSPPGLSQNGLQLLCSKLRDAGNRPFAKKSDSFAVQHRATQAPVQARSPTDSVDIWPSPATRCHGHGMPDEGPEHSPFCDLLSGRGDSNRLQAKEPLSIRRRAKAERVSCRSSRCLTGS